MSELMTTRQVAEHCRVTPDTVRAWKREKKLSAAGRTGKGWLFKRSDVDAMLASGLGVAAPPKGRIVQGQIDALLARRLAERGRAG